MRIKAPIRKQTTRSRWPPTLSLYSVGDVFLFLFYIRNTFFDQKSPGHPEVDVLWWQKQTDRHTRHGHGDSMTDPAQRAESVKSPSHTRVIIRHTRGHKLRRSCLTTLIVKNLSQSLVTWRHIQLFTKKRMYLNFLIMTSYSSILVVVRYTRSHRLKKKKLFWPKKPQRA